MARSQVVQLMPVEGGALVATDWQAAGPALVRAGQHAVVSAGSDSQALATLLARPARWCRGGSSTRGSYARCTADSRIPEYDILTYLG